MKLNKVETYSEYSALVDRYRKKGTVSNDYIQREVADLIVHDSLFYRCEKENIFFFVRKDGFYRLYFYINDFLSPFEVSEDQFVTEILFRGDLSAVSEEIRYLQSCGFQENVVRDQYFAKYISIIPGITPTGVEIDIAQSLPEVEWAADLFNSSFDRWSGDYISKDLCKLLFNEKLIITCKDCLGSLLGACHVEVFRGANWLRHIAVSENARGRGVGMALLNAFIEKGHENDESRYMLWVQRNNLAAVNMYKKRGFTYLGKSTLSMIKF